VLLAKRLDWSMPSHTARWPARMCACCGSTTGCTTSQHLNDLGVLTATGTVHTPGSWLLTSNAYRERPPTTTWPSSPVRGDASASRAQPVQLCFDFDEHRTLFVTSRWRPSPITSKDGVRRTLTSKKPSGPVVGYHDVPVADLVPTADGDSVVAVFRRPKQLVVRREAWSGWRCDSQRRLQRVGSCGAPT
jgi:hypothetical protein